MLLLVPHLERLLVLLLLILLVRLMMVPHLLMLLVRVLLVLLVLLLLVLLLIASVSARGAPVEIHAAHLLLLWAARSDRHLRFDVRGSAETSRTLALQSASLPTLATLVR